jgi:hypothetical protein
MLQLPYLGGFSGGAPTPGTKDIATTGVPNLSVTNPYSTKPFEAQQQLGNQLMQTAVQTHNVVQDVLSRQQQLEQDEKKRLDKLVAFNAMISVKTNANNLRTGEGGFETLHGTQIIGGESNGLMENYLNQYDAGVEQAISKLTPDQQAIVRLKAAEGRVGFTADFQRQQLKEYNTYAEQTASNALAVEEKTVANNYYKPAEIIEAKMRVADILKTAFPGAPDALIEAKKQGSYEIMNAAVVAQALADNNVEYARQYMKDNGHEMDVSDRVKYGNAITEHVENQAIDSTVSSLTGDLEQRFLPNSFDRLRSLVADAESGNQDFKNGRAVQSPKGALYAMQVTPETAARPGYGIKPAQNGTAVEFNRVGTEKLAAMLSLFGNDVPKALGAYNWGEGNVQEAVKAATLFNSQPSKERAETGNKTWLDFAPEETKKYVAKVVNGYRKGENAIAKPTVLELKKQVAMQMQGQRPEAIEKAQNKVEARYKDIEQGINQTQEQALLNVKDAVDKGQIRSVDDLNPDQLAMLGPKKRALDSYIKAANKSQDEAISNRPEAIIKVSEWMHNPELLKNAKPSEILELSNLVGRDNAIRLLNTRDEYNKNPGSQLEAEVDSDLFKVRAVDFGYSLKTDSPDAVKLLHLKDKVTQRIIEDQTAKGGKLSRQEKDTIIKEAMLEYPEVKTGERERVTWGYVFRGKDIIESKKGYEIRDKNNIKIPVEDEATVKGMIIERFTSRGLTPTPQQILKVYNELLLSKHEYQLTHE